MCSLWEKAGRNYETNLSLLYAIPKYSFSFSLKCDATISSKSLPKIFVWKRNNARWWEFVTGKKIRITSAYWWKTSGKKQLNKHANKKYLKWIVLFGVWITLYEL